MLFFRHLDEPFDFPQRIRAGERKSQTKIGTSVNAPARPV
jgi:hypothetical protein